MSLPSAPVLLLHQGYQHRDLVVPIGAARLKDGNRSPGLLLDWGAVHDEGVRDLASKSSPLSPVLAHPGAARFERRKIGQHKDAAPWIQRKAPSTDDEWRLAIRESVTAQSELKVDGVILLSRLLDVPDWPDNFQVLIDATRKAWSEHGTEPTFISLILAETWVTDPRLRRTLLNQLTDLPAEINVALHIHWDSGKVYSDPGMLENLSIIVRSLANDGRKVLLIESGLIGWLAIAWGGWGLTVGLPMTSWMRSTEEIRRTAGQKTQRVKRFFETQLLHRVRQPVHVRLSSNSNYAPCKCTFCAALNPALDEAWDFQAADQHALYCLSALTDEIAAPRLEDRADRIRRRIEAAISFERSLSGGLPGDSKPTHLSAWRSVI